MKNKVIASIFFILSFACGIFTLVFAGDDPMAAAAQLTCIAAAFILFILGIVKKIDKFFTFSILLSIIACLPAIATIIIVLLALIKGA